MPKKRTTATPASPDAVEKFKELIKAARQEYRKARKKASADGVAHQAALRWAREHCIPGAEALLNGGLATWQDTHLDEALTNLRQTEVSPALEDHGRYLEGILLTKLKRIDEAIAAFDQVVASPGSSLIGGAYFGMGYAFDDKSDYDRAIQCYQKALDTPGYDEPGNAHFNMGNAFADKGDNDRAIQCYQKALDTPGNDNPGRAHNNMGSAFHDKGDYVSAIQCYQKALGVHGYKSPHLARTNLANSLRQQGRFAEALEAIHRILEEPDTEGQHARAKTIKRLIEEARAGLKPSAAEEAVAKPLTDGKDDSPETRMLEKLGKGETRSKDRYEEYLAKDLAKEDSKRDQIFSCLRGWSSAVTLLEGGGERRWRGGGYFLKWQGKGIVIDPGFDFIDNFHDAGYNAREIDAVLVSHNHSDHNYDLNSLDDLRYELYGRWKTNNENKDNEGYKDKFPGMGLSHCFFALDEDTAKTFRDDSQAHRGSASKFTAADGELKRWYERIHGLPFTVEHFKVQHGADVPHAVGMRLRLHGKEGESDFVVGYTGDTRYFEGLPAQLKGCDLLLAHISMPDDEEFLPDKFPDYLKGDKWGKGRGVHLGYNGLARLIKEAQPKMVLLGEFWAGLADLRIDLAHGLRSLTGGAIPILPTGLGFHLHLPSLEVECTACRKPVDYRKLKIAPATSAFGPLGYLCPRCLL